MGRQAERDPKLIAAISEAKVISDARDRSHAELPVPDRMSGLLTGGSLVMALAIWWLLRFNYDWMLYVFNVWVRSRTMPGRSSP